MRKQATGREEIAAKYLSINTSILIQNIQRTLKIQQEENKQPF